MTADEKTKPADRAAALLQRGPAPLPAASWRRRARSLVRATLLRAARPQARHQRELDAALIAAVRDLEGELAALRERDGERIDHVERLALELIKATESVRRQAEHAGRTAAWARGAIEPIAAELRASPYVRDGFLEHVASPVGGAIGFRCGAAGPARLEADRRETGYAAFEDIFRGPSERVADSQRCYLTLLEGHAPVLDVGCGRGELLELLAAAGIEAEGVDGDPGMVARCRERGLRATLADANEHLEGVADGSLGAIFSAQVIEHLPHADLQRLLSLALRKLRPEGLLIAETVNPHRISSLKTFWVDLTHQHPIFPEVALALCMIAGFEAGYVFMPGFEDFETGRLESPSYAVVASSAKTAV